MYPEYAEINGKKYKINSDFRNAIKCNEIAMDKSIGDLERALGIVYTLFGEEGIRDIDNLEPLLKMAIKFIKCGYEDNDDTNGKPKEPDIDYIEDQNYISSSFKYDYNYNPYKMEYLHWWEFWNDLNNLSNSEFGTCCILNRIRQIRNCDLSKIKDPSERKRMQELKKQVALKKKGKIASDKEKQSARNFYEEFFKK